MKKRIFGILGILVAFVFLLSSCGLTEVEQSQEDYNYNKIIPKIMDFSGPTTVSASGLAVSEYSVLYRGGSTYTFTAVGYGATIETGEMPNHANVTWNQSSVDTSAILIAVETTQGGVVSDPDTLEITLNKFCPLTINDFLGDWTGTEAGDCDNDPFTVTFVAGAEENTIVAEATAGIPAFLACVFIGWTEVFQAGFGNEGDIILTIGLLDGTVTINQEYMGQTLPGPYDYDQNGSGTWSGCGAAPTMTFDFGLDASMWRKSTMTLTKVTK
jgi:hypothetical protein